MDVGDGHRVREEHPGSARGITAWATLAVLADHEGASTAELVDLTRQSRRTVLDHLQRLDADGLVERRRGRTAHEPHRCWLTVAGWQLHRSQHLTSPPPASRRSDEGCTMRVPTG